MPVDSTTMTNWEGPTHPTAPSPMDQSPHTIETRRTGGRSFDRSRRSTEWRIGLGSEACTVITGPAGSGKSCLMRQWFDALARSDAQPIWRTAIAGAGSARPTDPTDVLGVSVAGRTLFIDDANHLDTDDLDAYLTSMASGRDDLPARIVLATRTVPTRLLEWSRKLTVRAVRMDDLEPPEGLIEEILRSHHPNLPARELTTLANRIGPWPALAHLAGRAICLPSAGADAAVHFDGNDLGVTDYLDTEIFAGLDTADQHFLVSCSILPVLSADACAMLTGDQFADERLRRLDRQHALIRPTASDGAWAWRPLTQT